MGGISVQISVARKHEATQRNTADSINEGKTWQRLRSEVQHCGKMWIERWIPDLRRTQRCQQRLYDYQAQAKRSLMQVRAVHAKARRALTSLRTCRLGKAGEEKKNKKTVLHPVTVVSRDLLPVYLTTGFVFFQRQRTHQSVLPPQPNPPLMAQWETERHAHWLRYILEHSQIIQFIIAWGEGWGGGGGGGGGAGRWSSCHLHDSFNTPVCSPLITWCQCLFRKKCFKWERKTKVTISPKKNPKKCPWNIQ